MKTLWEYLYDSVSSGGTIKCSRLLYAWELVHWRTCLKITLLMKNDQE